MLLVEKSVFQRKKLKQKKKIHSDDDDDELVDNDEEDEGGEEVDSEDDDENEVSEEDKGDDSVYGWGKKIDEALRRWIDTKECRRNVVDEHFQNPPGRKSQSSTILISLSDSLTQCQNRLISAVMCAIPHQ